MAGKKSDKRHLAIPTTIRADMKYVSNLQALAALRDTDVATLVREAVDARFGKALETIDRLGSTLESQIISE